MVLEFLSLSPWAHVQMHRVKGVVETTSKYYAVGYVCDTGTPHLQKQLDSIKGAPAQAPLTPRNDANSDLNCDPCLSLCPLSRTYKLKKKKKRLSTKGWS